MRSTIITLATLLAGVAPAIAQEGKKEKPVERTLLEKEPYQLVYDHVTAKFQLFDDDGKVVRGWSGVEADRATGVAAPVPPNRPLEVVVMNANSLVYNYDISAEVLGTRRVRACQDLGREFVTQGILTTGRSLIGGAKLPDLGTVMEDIKKLVPEEGFGFTDASKRESAMAEARLAATRYLQLTSYVATLANTLGDSIVSIATLADTEPIDSLVDRLLLSIEREYPGLSDPRMAPVVVARAKRDATALLSQVAQGGGPTDPLTQEANSLRQRIDGTNTATAAEVRKVQIEVMRLRRARAASRQMSMLPPSELGRRVIIEMDEAPDSTRRGVLAVREGQVIAYTRPAVGMLCQISVGLNWMRPATEYDIANGMVQEETGSDDIRTSPGVFFSVGSPSFPLVGLLGGIGLGNGGRPDLYLGGTLRALAPVLINFGAVWQREMVLPAGLASGQAAPAGFTEFDRTYRPSFFAGLSFGR